MYLFAQLMKNPPHTAYDDLREVVERIAKEAVIWMGEDEKELRRKVVRVRHIASQALAALEAAA